MSKTTEWLSAQKKLLEAATPGPWSERISPTWFDPILTTQAVGPLCHDKPNEDPYVQANKDAAFIASVRTEHERALKLIEHYRNKLEHISRESDDGGFSATRHDIQDCADEALEYFPD